MSLKNDVFLLLLLHLPIRRLGSLLGLRVFFQELFEHMLAQSFSLGPSGIPFFVLTAAGTPAARFLIQPRTKDLMVSMPSWDMSYLQGCLALSFFE